MEPDLGYSWWMIHRSEAFLLLPWIHPADPVFTSFHFHIVHDDDISSSKAEIRHCGLALCGKVSSMSRGRYDLI